MTAKEITKSRLALQNAGTLDDRNQLRARLIAKLRNEVDILKQQRDAISADFRRQLERWRTESIEANFPVSSIPTDTQDSRLYRITAVFALLCEMGLAAWIFWHLGVGWLFGVLTALFITITLHGVFLQIFNDPERPKETVHRLKTRAALPAIVGFLTALGIGILARYVSGGMALLLLPLFSFSLWLGTVSLLILAASLFTLAHVLGWSARHDKAYRKLDDEERASTAFLSELQPEAARMPASSQTPAGEVLPALREHSPDGKRSPVLPVILILIAAFSFTNGCATAISPRATSTAPQAAEANTTGAPIPKGGANLHILIDWSGSCVRPAMEECWATIKEELPTIIEGHHITHLELSSFDEDGWCPRQIREIQLPERTLPPKPARATTEWTSFSNIREALEESQQREWRTQGEAAEQQYQTELQQALNTLETLNPLPDPNHQSRKSDPVGLLKRISQSRNKNPQYYILLTDMADTQYREIPQIPAPARTETENDGGGEARVLLLLIPANPEDANATIGKPLSGPEQFALRQHQLQHAAPWVTIAPHFAKNLVVLFKPTQRQSAQISTTHTPQNPHP